MGPATIASLGWLGKVIAAIRAVRARVMRRAIKIKSYIADLVALEKTTGQDTGAWAKLRDMKAAGSGTSLTAEETAYLCEFKDLWDKHFKAPLSKLSELVGDDKVKAVLSEIDGEDD